MQSESSMQPMRDTAWVPREAQKHPSDLSAAMMYSCMPAHEQVMLGAHFCFPLQNSRWARSTATGRSLRGRCRATSGCPTATRPARRSPLQPLGASPRGPTAGAHAAVLVLVIDAVTRKASGCRCQSSWSVVVRHRA